MDQYRDRITLSRPRAVSYDRPPSGRGKQLWSVAIFLGVIVGLGWTVVPLGDASSATGTAPAASRKTLPKAEVLKGLPAGGKVPDEPKGLEAAAPPAEPVQAQGPALTMPEEVVAMFQQRQQEVERREKAVRTSEERLATLRAEIEQILSKVEAAEQRRLQTKAQQEKVAASQNAVQSAAQKKQAAEQHSQKYAQLTKIYESMPAEEAAARIEKMPDRKALEILRLVKGKTAGSILAQVKVDRAAKLTEQLLSNP